MKIAVIPPNEKVQVREIEGTLEEMQEIVGGYIETVLFEELPGLLIVCNEEGKLLGLEDNFYNFNDIICGTAFVCKTEGEEFVGLTDEELKQVKDLL